MSFCGATSFIIMLALMCYQKNARTVPINYILLAAFTVLFIYNIIKICKAILVSFLCALTKPELVLMAAIMTAGKEIGFFRE